MSQPPVETAPINILRYWQSRHNPPRDTRPSFTGRNVLVTGANTGLGYEAALKFVQLDAARVILGVRTVKKGEHAKAAIEDRTGRKNVVEVWQIDMLDYESIKAFAARADREIDHLDIAVLNAGIIATAYEQSVYGWERTLQVNVLSTTLLSLLLLPKMRASKAADFKPVLEIVSSLAHQEVKAVGRDPDTDEGPMALYNRPGGFLTMHQYYLSKLFVEYAHAGLARLSLDEKSGEPNVFIISVCPGATRTELARDVTKDNFFFRIFEWLFGRFLMRTAEEGARTYITALTLGEEGHGRFFMDDKIQEPAPMLVGIENERLQAKVWSEIIEALEKEIPEVKTLAEV